MKKSVRRRTGICPNTYLALAGIASILLSFVFRPEQPLISPVPVDMDTRQVYAAERTIHTLTSTIVPFSYKREATKSAESIIREVFGKHADKALMLLSCENKALNPAAVNHNKDKDGVVLSSDYGVFQINNKWQKVGNTRFLTDPEINVRIAWRIYEDNGYSFKLWTCGKRMGI